MYPYKLNNFAALIFFILPVIVPLPAYDQEKPFVFVINPCSGRYEALMKDWRMPFTRRDIREWSASRGLALLDDRGPVLDDTAAYVGPFGSSIQITGLSRDTRYRVWIDFVRFRKGENRPDSLLKIFAAAPGMEARLIDTVRYSGINDTYYRVDLPAVVTARGRADVRFEELSAAPGCWGVWDIIVTGAGGLPGRNDIPGDEGINLEINDRIVQ